MTTPQRIAELIGRTTAREDRDERPGHLVLRASLDDPASRAEWLALRKEPPPFIGNVAITEIDDDIELDEHAPPEPGGVYRITIKTATVAGQLRLFLSASLAAWIDQTAEVDVVMIADMGPEETFATRRARFQLWTTEEPEAFAPSEPAADPRAFCSDFTGTHQTPSDIRPWLIRSAPARQGESWAIWTEASSRKLMAAISDGVSNSTHGLLYHFSGPPACTLSLTDAEVTALNPELQAAAKWIFLEGRDADTRHMFMAAEWARTHRAGAAGQLGKGSLASAMAAWSAYAKSGSKETLKALTDLRKAVVDEGQKAAQRAQDMAGAMWKDIAIASVPFLLKILPDVSKLASQRLAGAFALIAAAFLVFSFGIQVYINSRYFRTQATARGVWKRALNTALTPDEVEEFSEVPIQTGIADYERVRLAIGIVYAVLVIALLVYAVANLSARVPTPPASASPAVAETNVENAPTTNIRPSTASKAPSSTTKHFATALDGPLADPGRADPTPRSGDTSSSAPAAPAAST
ncbi:hypothetical protein [Brevundimonas diminuta]|uniref:hypothetical protein n=1 Tax=Brevundimonas diminuta TaxID=293 RepID=UPI003D03998A